CNIVEELNLSGVRVCSLDDAVEPWREERAQTHVTAQRQVRLAHLRDILLNLRVVLSSAVLKEHKVGGYASSKNPEQRGHSADEGRVERLHGTSYAPAVRAAFSRSCTTRQPPSLA